MPPQPKKQLPPANDLPNPTTVSRTTTLEPKAVVNPARSTDGSSVTQKLPILPGKSAWDLIDTMKILMYGESGTGKTTLWATFPKPILAIICSGGKNPGELKSIDTPEYRNTITPRIVNSTEEYRQLIALAKGFATVVLDHCSGLQDLILKEILGVEAVPQQRPIIGDNKRTWGEVALQGKTLMVEQLNLPTNIVFISQQRVFEKPEGSLIGESRIGAALTPALAGWLAPACDYVVQTFKRPKVKKTVMEMAGVQQEILEATGESEYCLRCDAPELYITKFRMVKGKGKPLPQLIVDPTYEKILRASKGLPI